MEGRTWNSYIQLGNSIMAYKIGFVLNITSSNNQQFPCLLSVYLDRCFRNAGLIV